MNKFAIRKHIRRYSLMLLACLFLALAWCSQTLFAKLHQEKQVAHQTQKKFTNLECNGTAEFVSICQLLNQNPDLTSFANTIDSLKQNKLLGDVLIQLNDSIVYYSDHSICFEKELYLNDSINSLPNGIYWQQKMNCHNYTLRYLIPLKHSYNVKNNYLKDSYLDKLTIPQGYQLYLFTPENTSFLPIYFLNGKPAFALKKTNKYSLAYHEQAIVSLLFILAFIYLINFLAFFIRSWHIPTLGKIASLLTCFALLYFIHLKAHFPQTLWNLNISQPTTFASSNFFPSITALAIFSLLCLTFSLFSYRLTWKTLSNKTISFILVLILFFYVGINYLITALIYNANFSMQLNEVNHLSMAGILAYLCISMLFLSGFLIQLKTFTSTYFNGKRASNWLGICSLIACSLGFIFSWKEPLSLIALFFISSWLIVLFAKSSIKRASIFYLISFTALYAFFTLITLQKQQQNQIKELRTLYAYNKYGGHDAEMELIFKNIEKEIQNDSIIPDRIGSGDFKFVEDYVEHEFLANINKQYHIWLSICSPNDELLIEPEGTYTPCYAFFNDMLKNSGSQIPNSNFYYIDTPNGLLSYFGKFIFNPSGEQEFTLFIQFEAKMMEQGIGFPELLTNESQIEPQKYSRFSFAKYHNNQLISIGGDYPYSFNISNHIEHIKLGITQAKWNNYNHTIYKNDKNDVVVISSPQLSMWQSIFSFPYIFLLYLFIAFIVVFFSHAKYRKELFNYDLSTRIQLAIVGTLFISLVLISSSTVLYNLKQYKEQHRNDLNEKMNAISQELNYQLNNNESIEDIQVNTIWENLGNWSNIFQTDINIYQTNGKLLATSRPALFNLGLSSRWMNSKALRCFNVDKELSLIQPENIGELHFLSAYQPIINNKGETICYINLPYFMRSDGLRQEILNFIVAFINLSVFLIFISIIAALALSNRITKPLSNIKESLRDMSISKQNKPIIYTGQDEIGELVHEYNLKLKELEQSAKLLAQSQREMAWKEMARQIAHEIKNPLTPMKLQVQHLQQTKKSGDMDRYNLMFDRVTATLIEQIDRLTAIANSFSQFAKMPEPQPKVLNLIELIQKVILLFEPSERTQIQFEYPNAEQITLFADGEQLSRAFINLIKNAEQAVPSEKQAHINISVQHREQQIRISIKDNGIGVPDDIANRLFEPNFTTKSSGMGLGLAIVKRSIESAKGKVWFKSTKNAGTTFFIELPVKEIIKTEANI